MKTNEQPAPDYGEPWHTDSARGVMNKNGEAVCYPFGDIVTEFRLAHRISSCVNACAGMVDPAAEIQAMREALEEARKCAAEWREHCLKRHTMSQIVSSKLPWDE